MAAHLRRFTDMHPAVIMVPSHLSEPAVLGEEEDRRVHGGHPLAEFGPPARPALLRHTHPHPAE